MNNSHKIIANRESLLPFPSTFAQVYNIDGTLMIFVQLGNNSIYAYKIPVELKGLFDVLFGKK